MNSLSPQVGKVDFITGRTSCLVPNTKATETGNIESIFDLFFDDNIIDKTVDLKNNTINEAIINLTVGIKDVNAATII